MIEKYFKSILLFGYNGKIFSYVDYFYKISFKDDDHELEKKLLNKVIELTEDDKYNETRLKAQEN